MEEREAQKRDWIKEEEGGIYRWGKSDRWKQITTKFSRKSRAAGLQAGQSGGRQKAP
jgi:hypothetical protein